MTGEVKSLCLSSRFDLGGPVVWLSIRQCLDFRCTKLKAKQFLASITIQWDSIKT